MKARISLAFASLLATAALGIAYAGDNDTVKSGTNLERPGRQIDDSVVKVSPKPGQPGRQIDESTVKFNAHPARPGRTADEDRTVRSGGSDGGKRPGRMADDSAAQQ